MITTVATTKTAAVPRIPPTISPFGGPIDPNPLGNSPPDPCAFAGVATATPRAINSTPHQAYFEVMLTPYICEIYASALVADNHTSLESSVIRRPESVGQPTSRIGPDQQRFPRRHSTMR